MTIDVIKRLEALRAEALQELKTVSAVDTIEQFRSKYLGRRGALNEIFKDFSILEGEVKKQAGERANNIKQELQKEIEKLSLSFLDTAPDTDFDETTPGVRCTLGTLHPITRFMDTLVAVFTSMGFEVVEDREIETTEYNFDKLNIPAHHPARDMWDTFYIASKSGKNKDESNVVMRTHTSPVQLRAMEHRRPPVRLVVPGRVYRHEATDASHETTFYQLEGLVIDQGVTVANMIHVLHATLKGLFGEKVRIRIRPSFFPFVEPGHEVDMSCILCLAKEATGSECSLCHGARWVEMLGCGMVHPTVLKNMKINPDVYSGFAFGMGIDRLMMTYFGVDDIRLSYSGDLRFLKQF